MPSHLPDYKRRSIYELKITLTRNEPGYLLVEAAGQLIRLFRDGLDYAFIPGAGMRGVLFIKNR